MNFVDDSEQKKNSYESLLVLKVPQKFLLLFYMQKQATYFKIAVIGSDKDNCTPFPICTLITDSKVGFWNLGTEGINAGLLSWCASWHAIP